MIELLAPALAACLLLACILSYFGLHVLLREVIFVDLALAQLARTRLPQEALIGIVYGVSAALVILLVSKSALDRDEVENMLTGRLLFAEWSEIGAMALLFVAVGALHFALRSQFLEISEQSRPKPHRPGAKNSSISFSTQASESW